MKKMTILSLGAAAFMASLAPAQAAFYYEGLMPLTDAPNCTDTYATQCGRYGQVPHYDGAKGMADKDGMMMPMAIEETHEHEHPKKVRVHTREGLDK